MSLGRLFGAVHDPLSPPKSTCRVVGQYRESTWRERLAAAGWHLVISLLVAVLGVATLVFGFWYPSIVREMVGGRELFLLVIIVDIVMGPLLTFVAFNQKKGPTHLRRDLSIIVVMQLAALGFGLHTVWQARPVHIVFEIDRLKVVTAADIEPASLMDAPDGLKTLPVLGPVVIAALKPKDPNEQFKSVELGLSGVDLAQQTNNWRTMDATLNAKLFNSGMPLSSVREKLSKKPLELASFNAMVSQTLSMVQGGEDALRAIPIQSRRVFWTALVNDKGEVLATEAVDFL